MERLIAYNLACRDCFRDRLTKENFRVEGKRQTKIIMPEEEDIGLGIFYDSKVIIYPESNVMSMYSISERTRLIRMCDEFKV